MAWHGRAKNFDTFSFVYFQVFQNSSLTSPRILATSLPWLISLMSHKLLRKKADIFNFLVKNRDEFLNELPKHIWEIIATFAETPSLYFFEAVMATNRAETELLDWWTKKNSHSKNITNCWNILSSHHLIVFSQI